MRVNSSAILMLLQCPILYLETTRVKFRFLNPCKKRRKKRKEKDRKCFVATPLMWKKKLLIWNEKQIDRAISILITSAMCRNFWLIRLIGFPRQLRELSCFRRMLITSHTVCSYEVYPTPQDCHDVLDISSVYYIWMLLFLSSGKISLKKI